MHACIHLLLLLLHNTTYTYIATVVQHWTIKVIDTFIDIVVLMVCQHPVLTAKELYNNYNY